MAYPVHPRPKRPELLIPPGGIHLAGPEGRSRANERRHHMHSRGTNARTANVRPIGSNLIFLVIGATVVTSGLGAFAPRAYAVIPTGGVPSPMFGVQKFTQPMPRFDVLPRNPVATLNPPPAEQSNQTQQADRKSTRLNSSHLVISYAVFCLKKKTNNQRPIRRGRLPRSRHKNLAIVSCH